MLLLDRLTQLDGLLVSFDDLKLPEIQLPFALESLFNGLLQVQSSLEQSICTKSVQWLLFINFLEANFLPEGLLLELLGDASFCCLTLGKLIDIADAYMPSFFLGSTNFLALGHRDVLPRIFTYLQWLVYGAPVDLISLLYFASQASLRPE